MYVHRTYRQDPEDAGLSRKTLTVQLQRNEMEHAKHMHNSSVVCCNRMFELMVAMLGTGPHPARKSRAAHQRVRTFLVRHET